MTTIGLCMIVKNEAGIIEQCLDDARPVVDYVLIEDTGSTDGTQDVVRRYLERNSQPPLSLRQVDPLIRQLHLYRDLIQERTKEPNP